MSRPKEGVTRVMPTMEAMIVMELANSCNRDREREREVRKRGERGKRMGECEREGVVDRVCHDYWCGMSMGCILEQSMEVDDMT